MAVAQGGIVSGGSSGGIALTVNIRGPFSIPGSCQFSTISKISV